MKLCHVDWQIITDVFKEYRSASVVSFWLGVPEYDDSRFLWKAEGDLPVDKILHLGRLIYGTALYVLLTPTPYWRYLIKYLWSTHYSSLRYKNKKERKWKNSYFKSSIFFRNLYLLTNNMSDIIIDLIAENIVNLIEKFTRISWLLRHSCGLLCI